MSQPQPQPEAAEPSQAEAAVDHALAGLPVVPSHYPVAYGFHPFGGYAFDCSCGSLWCDTPARHPIGVWDLDNATTDIAEVVRRWTAHPEANIATPASQRFGLIQLRHPATPAAILAWLTTAGITPGPVIHAGPSHLDFLVALSPPIPADSGSTQLAHLDDGLVLLPPGRAADGSAITWLRPLDTPLPPAGPLLDSLATLPSSTPDAVTPTH